MFVFVYHITSHLKKTLKFLIVMGYNLKKYSEYENLHCLLWLLCFLTGSLLNSTKYLKTENVISHFQVWQRLAKMSGLSSLSD